MKGIIKVKITSTDEDNWYRVGQELNVKGIPKSYTARRSGKQYDAYPVDGNPSVCVEVGHCEIIPPTLQEQLQEAKNNVEAIEKLLAEEANKPFSREDYERVVAQYRACEGRKVFVAGGDNHCLEIGDAYTCSESWDSISSVAPFGVWFGSFEEVEEAVKVVGEDMLRKAWQFEMSIGL